MAIKNVTLNPNDRNGTHTLSNGNLTDIIASTNANIRATHGKARGKWYWEVKLDSGDVAVVIGVTNKSYPITSTSFTDANLRAYHASSALRYPEGTAFGSAWVVGVVIGVALDLDNGTLEFYRNGVNLGFSHTNLKVLGEVFPFITTSTATTRTITVNFGATAFAYPIPSGFMAYVNYPIVKMTLKNLATSKVYSLDNKTLIHFSFSDKNMILHGVDTGKEIKLDEDFNKMEYVIETNEVLGVGKTYTHTLDMNKTKVNKIIL